MSPKAKVEVSVKDMDWGRAAVQRIDELEAALRTRDTELAAARTVTYQTNGTAWRLLRRLTKVADHGGPSNWRTFIEATDEQGLVADLDTAGYLDLGE